MHHQWDRRSQPRSLIVCVGSAARDSMPIVARLCLDYALIPLWGQLALEPLHDAYGYDPDRRYDATLPHGDVLGHWHTWLRQMDGVPILTPVRDSLIAAIRDLPAGLNLIIDSAPDPLLAPALRHAFPDALVATLWLGRLPTSERPMTTERGAGAGSRIGTTLNADLVVPVDADADTRYALIRTHLVQHRLAPLGPQ